jgi:hypothetical protein
LTNADVIVAKGSNQLGWSFTLRVHRWPVAVILVAKSDPDALVWRLVNDAFAPTRPARASFVQQNEQEVVSEIGPIEVVDDEERLVPVKYASIPPGMKQMYPHLGKPEPIDVNRQYVIAVRETVADDVRQFAVSFQRE